MVCLSAGGCGDESGDDGPGGVRQPCVNPFKGPLSNVDLRVGNALPAELTSLCAQGDESELQARLQIPPTRVCDSLTVQGGQVQGCCGDVAVDQVVDLVLFYQVAGPFRLLEQGLRLDLDNPSTPIIEVSFAGEPVSTFGPLADWCAGTL